MPRGAKLPTFRDHLSNLDAALDRVLATKVAGSGRTLKGVREALELRGKRLVESAEKLDPVIRPRSTFDPTDPVTAGRVVALTLVAQRRHKLGRTPEFYGSGVYALYYTGDVKPFAPYEPLAKRDHPIYVGKADPEDPAAKSAVGQGKELAKRLREHAARIKKASSTLSLDDFECRFLICQSGFQRAAESYLVNFFQPIWNSEVGICFGMSKHGDAAGTRANGRSPWFTLHPGVKWADHPDLMDQKPGLQIVDEISKHFTAFPPLRDIHEIFELFMSSLQQVEIPEADEEIPLDADEGGPTDA